VRFLNAACKLLGAVWARRQAADAGLCWDDTTLTVQLGDSACAIAQASARLSARLAARLPRHCDRGLTGLADIPRTAGSPPGGAVRVAVLAGTGSASAARFSAMAAAAGVPVHGVCWYGLPDAAAGPSGYSAAWYPPGSGSSAAPPPVMPVHVRQARAVTWKEAALALTSWGADLVVLLGMPIVPAELLSVPRLGMINAHNGALPSYRGMDAVGWAVLNNDPIVCSVHQVAAGADTGPVMVAQPVPFPPAGGLKARMKNTQLLLLTAAAVRIAAAGHRGDAVRQDPALARQFYRLHPHLKRVLDASACRERDSTEGTAS
jgi:hypothetical protein